MPYDRFGNPVPTPRDGANKRPSTVVTLAVCAFVILLLALSVIFGMHDGEKADSDTEESATIIRHDSLAPSYTYDGEIIRWYVFIDPDKGREYLYSDHGHCTPRLERNETPTGEEAE